MWTDKFPLVSHIPDLEKGHEWRRGHKILKKVEVGGLTFLGAEKIILCTEKRITEISWDRIPQIRDFLSRRYYDYKEGERHALRRALENGNGSTGR